MWIQKLTHGPAVKKGLLQAGVQHSSAGILPTLPQGQSPEMWLSVPRVGTLISTPDSSMQPLDPAQKGDNAKPCFTWLCGGLSSLKQKSFGLCYAQSWLGPVFILHLALSNVNRAAWGADVWSLKQSNSHGFLALLLSLQKSWLSKVECRARLHLVSWDRASG